MDFNELFRDKKIRNKLIILASVVLIMILTFVYFSISKKKEMFNNANDDVGPKIVRVTSTNEDGLYSINQDIDIILEFNEEIKVSKDGVPRLALNFDNGVKYAYYVESASRTAMTFRYNIIKGDSTSQLNYTSEDALEVRGATIKDKKGNKSNLILPLINTESSLAGNKKIQVLTDEPYPIIFEEEITGEIKEYTIVFNKKVKGFDNNDIKVSEGLKSNFKEIEAGRVYKCNVSRAGATESSIWIEKGVCKAEDTGLANSYGVPIPSGFYYFGGSKEDGIVISDNIQDANKNFYTVGKIDGYVEPHGKGNCFVWVPVDYVNDKHGEFTVSNKRVTTSNFGRRIYPCYGNINEYSESIDEDLLKSVLKYQGYYVGRYEAVFDQEETVGSRKSIPNREGGIGVYEDKSDNDEYQPIGALYNYLQVSTAKNALENTYEDSKSVVAHLPYAAEWDTLVKWIEESGVNVRNDSSEYGNYFDTNLTGVKNENVKKLLNTGTTEETTLKNIYDLAGNLWELTQETRDGLSVVRGGCCSSSGKIATISYRSVYDGDLDFSLCGARIFLYMKY